MCFSQHPDVQAAVVLVREDSPGDKRLAAYVVGPVEALSVSELREHLQHRLPAYMVPAVFVFLDALPLTPNGKVDRKALPAPDVETLHDDAYVAPRTPIEQGLAEMWSEVLHVERIGVHDSFFELGGHSLVATQVMSRIRNTFQIDLPLRALFEAPSVAALSERVLDLKRTGASLEFPPLKRVGREGMIPLSYAQQRLWFIDRLNPGTAVYNVPKSWRLRGVMDVDAMQQALEAIVARHEVLRSRFVDQDGNVMRRLYLPIRQFRLPCTMYQEWPNRRSSEKYAGSVTRKLQHRSI